MRASVLQKLGYYLSRPGHHLLILFSDKPLRIVTGILVFKLLLFSYITGYEMVSFFSSLGTILMILSFSLFIKHNVVKSSYLFGVDFLFSVLLFCHSLYFGYFDDIASAFCLKEIHQVRAVSDIITAMIGKELLFVADLIVLPVFLFKFKKVGASNILEKSKTWVFLLLIGLLFNAYSLLYNLRSTDNFFVSIYSRSQIVRIMGIVNYQFIDLYYFLLTENRKSQVSSSDIDTVVKWRAQNKGQMKHYLTGLGKVSNLIVIQVESLQNFVIGKRCNDIEITPNLNKLVKEGIYFNNVYDQTAAGNSSDAAFLVNSSLYPSRKGAACFLYTHNSFDSLPKLLHENGYVTATMHAYNKNFWNRAEFEKAIGFEHQYYEDSYNITDKIAGNISGLSDKSFFSQSVQKIKHLPTPSFILLTTLSTHAPFSHITSDIDDFPLADLEGEIIGDYIRAMHYVDSAIGEFLQELHKHNLSSNTVIVIYGDHRTRLPKGELERINVSYIGENKKIPLIIRLPDRKQRVEGHDLGGLIDVAPTVCNILGIDFTDKFFLGRDLLNDDRNFVIFRDGSYIRTNESVDKAFAQRNLMISDLILEKDLIPLIRKRKSL